MQRIGFVLCAVVLLLGGCPKTNTDGGGATREDAGSAHATGASGGGDAHSGGNAGAGSGGNSSGSGSGGSHGAMGVDAGSGHAGHDSQAGSGGDSGHDSGVTQDAGASMTPSCDTQDCADGTHCELVQVQCIRAPCPPEPQCVMDSAAKHCGGFAGLPCPGLSECVDDPSDSCDPNHGGADCGGICECNKAAACVQGKHWNGTLDVCDCVSDTR